MTDADFSWNQADRSRQTPAGQKGKNTRGTTEWQDGKMIPT